jgi:hypothetical protein
VEGREIEIGGADILESAADRPPSRRMATAGFVLSVLAAAAVGYVAGDRHDAIPAPVASRAPAGGSISTTGHRCSEQLGTRLELGVEILNGSGTPATPRRIGVKLPLGGLRPVATRWGSCGQLPSTPAAGSPALAPGATTWVATTFDVLADCPGPLPVSFTVDYDQDGHSKTADLPGFVDLGDVPYSTPKCR